MIPINTSITWLYPIITRIAWWYHSPQAVYDDTHYLTRCMTKSTQAFYIRIPDVTYHHIRYLTISDHHIHCSMIPFISSCAWWSLSSQWLHDDINQHKHHMIETVHHKHCMMIPFHTCLAWWYHSSQALHGDTYHHKPCIMNLSYPAMQYRNNWRDETQGQWRTTEDSRECSLDSLLETAGHLVNLT